MTAHRQLLLKTGLLLYQLSYERMLYYLAKGLFNDGPPSAAIENWAAALPTELRADVFITYSKATMK